MLHHIVAEGSPVDVRFVEQLEGFAQGLGNLADIVRFIGVAPEFGFEL